MTAELWAALCAWGVLLVRVGMALHDSGSVRAKNSSSAILRAMADLCIAALAFWAVGGAILFGQRFGGVFSFNTTLFGGPPAHLAGQYAFVLAAAVLASGIVPGVLGERSRFLPAAATSLLLGAVLMPLAAYWARGGWLAWLGFHDFAGASFIHLAGAVCAAVGVIYVGPRMGKYNRDGSSNAIPGHSVPLASVGTLLMLVGWLPYVAGFGSHATIGPAALNVLLAAAAGGLGGMLFCQMRYGKPDVHLVYGGILGALVAISAGADVLPPWAAVLTGLATGLLTPMALLSLDLIWRMDDPTSGVTLHGVAGAWGLIATGLFAPAESVMGKFKLIGVQCLGVVAIGLLAAALSVGLFELLKRVTRLRSREADEFDGLDLAEHDIGAYPDFQQNTIKSYHLREA